MEISLLPGSLTETAGSYELNPGDKLRVIFVFDVSRIQFQLVCWLDKRETTILEAHQFNDGTEIIQFIRCKSAPHWLVAVRLLAH